MEAHLASKKIISPQETLTFEDILIRPCYSEILPAQTDLRTQFSRQLPLAIPLVSSAMDTVTEAQTAICLALAGGIGVIHKNLLPQVQAQQVAIVKNYLRSVILGQNYPELTSISSVDHQGRLLVAGAIGVSEAEFSRSQELIAAGVDALVIDTAHGHSAGVIQMLRRIKDFWPNGQVLAGNVATPEGCRDLIAAGVDGIKVGIGPGSICTTRIIAGIGVPQVTAIADCYEVCGPAQIPLIADGGIRFSGDIVKALALGASCVMIGSLFAGHDETPGEVIETPKGKFKRYRGMGSLGAMVKGSKDRYGQGETQEKNKLVPEGVEGQVNYKGPLAETIFQLLGGARSGMGYVGAKDLGELRAKSEFIRISKASYKEGLPHDILNIEEAPNYKK